MLSKKTIQYLSSIFLSIAFHLLSDEASHLWTDLWIFNHENLRKHFQFYNMSFTLKQPSTPMVDELLNGTKKVL